jgi:glyoxylase-like metal-dependent hydrolase (beta-lactamase superfamily II)
MAWPVVTIVNIGCLSMNRFWGEKERMRSATATCTLVEAPGARLLVDPSPHPPELERLLFDRAGLKPDQIDAVFLTHHHGDHRYGLDLFPRARRLMAAAGLAEWRERSPGDAAVVDAFEPAEGRLPEGLRLLGTPGHTASHHSLAMGSPWGTLVAAGDAVMTADFFAAEEGYHNSVDFAAAAETIRMLKREASLLIPGHGNLIINRPAGVPGRGQA